MAEEKRGQESGMRDWALQKQCSRSSRRSRGITDLGENLRGEGKAPSERLPLFPWVVPLTHSSNVIKWNSEPEKCYPTNRTIGSLLSMIITKTLWQKCTKVRLSPHTPKSEPSALFFVLRLTFSFSGLCYSPLKSVHIKQKRREYFHDEFSGADYEARTRYLHLGKVALYQMS